MAMPVKNVLKKREDWKPSTAQTPQVGSLQSQVSTLLFRVFAGRLDRTDGQANQWVSAIHCFATQALLKLR